MQIGGKSNRIPVLGVRESFTERSETVDRVDDVRSGRYGEGRSFERALVFVRAKVDDAVHDARIARKIEVIADNILILAKVERLRMIVEREVAGVQIGKERLRHIERIVRRARRVRPRGKTRKRIIRVQNDASVGENVVAPARPVIVRNDRVVDFNYAVRVDSAAAFRVTRRIQNNRAVNQRRARAWIADVDPTAKLRAIAENKTVDQRCDSADVLDRAAVLGRSVKRERAVNKGRATARVDIDAAPGLARLTVRYRYPNKRRSAARVNINDARMSARADRNARRRRVLVPNRPRVDCNRLGDRQLVAVQGNRRALERGVKGYGIAARRASDRVPQRALRPVVCGRGYKPVRAGYRVGKIDRVKRILESRRVGCLGVLRKIGYRGRV